jgi:hypothetical protein
MVTLWLLLVADSASAQPQVARAQVRFAGPTGLQVWVQRPGGQFPQAADITAPGRLNLQQGHIYRLKLASIPGHPGVMLYPTLQLGGGDARTAAFLRASAIQIELTADDFAQAAKGELLTKVIYLPDAGGRGPVLATLRMGNIDLEVPR